MSAASRAEYYRQRASQCERLAETMADQGAIFSFLKAANEWRKLAQRFDEEPSDGGMAARKDQFGSRHRSQQAAIWKSSQRSLIGSRRRIS